MQSACTTSFKVEASPSSQSSPIFRFNTGQSKTGQATLVFGYGVTAVALSLSPSNAFVPLYVHSVSSKVGFATASFEVAQPS